MPWSVTASNTDATDFVEHTLSITMTDDAGRVVRCRIYEDMLDDPAALATYLRHVIKDPRFEAG